MAELRFKTQVCLTGYSLPGKFHPLAWFQASFTCGWHSSLYLPYLVPEFPRLSPIIEAPRHLSYNTSSLTWQYWQTRHSRNPRVSLDPSSPTLTQPSPHGFTSHIDLESLVSSPSLVSPQDLILSGLDWLTTWLPNWSLCVQSSPLQIYLSVLETK